MGRNLAAAADDQADRTRALTAQETEWKQRINERLLSVLDLSLIDSVDTDSAREEIRSIVDRLLTEESAPLSRRQRQLIIERIEDEVMGLGPLEPLLADHTISDILVNGYDTVYIERHGKLELTNTRFTDPSHLLNTIDRIVSAVGRRIDESSPMVDARLADGSRVNVIIPPLALDGAILSIRRFGVELLTMEKLIELETVTAEAAAVLSAIVKARLNVVVSGGTGSGKTTLLNVLSSFIPEDERIVTVEDSAELQLDQEHLVSLETRPPNVEGTGGYTIRDLVKNALRMRPDRIIVGEVRGEEALDMLQAMNTGHDGSLTTVHANSSHDVVSRIETMCLQAADIPVSAIRRQFTQAIELIVHIRRLKGGRRLIAQITEVMGIHPNTGEVEMRDIMAADGVLNYGSFAELTRLLPNATFVDATDVVGFVRYVKSDEEIACLRRAAAIAEAGIEEMAAEAHEGVDEAVLYARVTARLMELGSEHYCRAKTDWSSGGYALVTGLLGEPRRRFTDAPIGRRLKEGTLITNEVNTSWGGIFAQEVQPILVGPIPEAWAVAVDVQREAFEAGLEKMAPGLTYLELVDHVRNTVRPPAGYRVIVIMHGQGTGEDGPLITERSDNEKLSGLRMEVGNTWVWKPIVVSDDGKVQYDFGGTVALTERGAERLFTRPVEFISVS